MEKKYSLILDDDFIRYCKLNNIEDIEKLAKETFAKGFSILKYGEKPNIIINKKIVPEPPKEEFTDIQIQKRTDSLLTTENLPEHPIKDLYDE